MSRSIPIPPLVHLRPRGEIEHVHQNRTVLAIDRDDGFIRPDSRGGLFVDDTRVLSRYVWCAHGEAVQPSGTSSIDARSWLGYYMIEPRRPDGSCVGKPPQQT